MRQAVVVTEPVQLSVTTVNIGTPDPPALARFYQRLLGWQISTSEPDWVVLRNPGGGVALAFQTESDYVRPTWPAGPGDQQMMMHLEISVNDLAAACEHAQACGATLAEWQPQDDVRVQLDPDGHPFCLYLD
jgi:catechol 2,3-dioxygenase-like lactoylglutathione lyase family enzyme